MVTVLEPMGVQTPRVRAMPPYVSSKGHVAIEVAEACGIDLDEWQRDVLVDACGVRADGKWSAFEIGLALSRQNGKGGVLEARELAGVTEFGERLVIHSAHEFATSTIAMERMEAAIEESGLTSELRPRGGILRSHGSEGFVFKSGARIWYRTRTAGGGRGFSGDLIVFDEAMILKSLFIGALMPTVSAKSMNGNPQLWYTGSAVDQTIHEHGLVFARLRARGHSGVDPSLAWFEWAGAPAVDDEGKAITPDHPDVAVLLNDPLAWAEANPAKEIRISEEHIANERRSMDDRTFAVERLGIGDWPDVTGEDGAVISLAAWDDLADEASAIGGGLSFTWDVSPGRDWASIAAGGLRDDGILHVEVVDRRRGTSWVAGRLAELQERHEPDAIGCATNSPAASLIREVEEAGVTVEEIAERDHAHACGKLVDLVTEGALRHLGTGELRAALKAARKRDLGDAWAWSRRNSKIDISPLVAATLAAWLANEAGSEPWTETW